MKSVIFFISLMIALTGGDVLAENRLSSVEVVRKPAVAGQFYTENAIALEKEIAGYIAGGKKGNICPRMLISPHAGLVFSGPVAGKGYALVDKNIKTVILIGPSHHEWFEGVSVSTADYYETPIGKVPLAKDEIAELRKNHIVHYVAAADIPEHSLEVQLPFLQSILASFKIVPVITGRVEPALLAEILYPFLNSSTLVVASSDLSHYHSSAEAKAIDKKTISTVLSGNYDGLIDACGETAIRTVMILAEKYGLKPELIDARNSCETAPQYCPESRVVGYASIAYY
jgi:MEMO1 family protein